MDGVSGSKTFIFSSEFLHLKFAKLLCQCMEMIKSTVIESVMRFRALLALVFMYTFSEATVLARGTMPLNKLPHSEKLLAALLIFR
ncbi:hypothetical protein WH50_10015 [Pokkaliibacter plantistimulans]|uniref:Uncharacterized protein n=1 Tax=Pokkaliibacter plantistimulans TaxID=1635171 RepID=A0ABX5LXR3_9GAMM|nr:hypothetical protein WH50_10015 [Pokkaliibacter plantistimulans]